MRPTLKLSDKRADKIVLQLEWGEPVEFARLRKPYGDVYADRLVKCWNFHDDLLAALEDIEMRLSDQIDGTGTGALDHMYGELCKTARAAIAKAKGVKT